MANVLVSTSQRHETLPTKYIRPEDKRPRLSEVVTGIRVPVIDLGSPDRCLIISQMAYACENYGFFQVVNHGISEELQRQVKEIGKQFFKLPPEEKEKLYSDNPFKKNRLSTSVNVRKEAVHNWRDYLKLECHPLEDCLPEWPSKPDLFNGQTRELGKRLFGYISESLGLEDGYIENVLGEPLQDFLLNLYPQCPNPELTYGLPAHTDPNTLTILLLDQQVAGLQILKDGKWIAIDPIPSALTVNIGDIL